MPQVALTILKYLFLFLIFLFLARAVRAMYLDISGPRAPRTPSTPPMATSKGGKAPDKLALLAGGKAQLFDLGDELILGRSGKCHVQLADTYASQVHARVFRRNGQFYLEDMGSTNGTYLNGRQLRRPEQLKMADKIRIGDTEYRYQE